MRSRLGECLAEAGFIDERDLARAIAEHERTGDRLGAVLTRMRLATEEQIAHVLAAQLGFPYFELTGQALDPAIVQSIPRELAVKAACIAVGRDDETLTVAMADPLLFSLVQELEARAGCRVREVVATQSAILAAIDAFYPERSDPDGDSQRAAAAHGNEASDPDAANRALDAVLQLVADADGADVHVEPTADGVMIRARTDGALVTVSRIPRSAHAELTARLKLMAGLDVSERLLPQAGRFRPGGDAPVALRLSTLRTEYGEKIVIRSIDRRKPALPFDDLGMSPIALTALEQAAGSQGGVIVISGPRGSGRTTTLASLLGVPAARGAHVVAIAAATEYAVSGVTPIATDDAVGLTTAVAVAAAMARNADVVAIDDLQDRAAADAAAHAAAAGCTVIIVLAADDAADAAVMLTTLASDAGPIVARLRVVAAQRLVRRLCPACRRPHPLTSDDLQALDIASAEALPGPIFDPVGCAECGFAGYRGRTGVFEVMHVSDDIRRMLRPGASVHELRHAARRAGMVSLAEEGRARLEAGVTALAELRRAVPDLRDARSVCVHCGSAVSPEHSACPHCGAPLGGVCAHCGRALQRGWSFCPFCARVADQSARPSKRGIMRLVRNPDPGDTV